jgi:bifunctional UDP-N-acetylglucosamine pyrophosphorylase/glucosamine-1-phosphate N-acetyltransferase
VGAYAELKNAKIGENTKVSHLAYVGDAIVGKNCNIGCGVVFCNYDGYKKSMTRVGDNVFLGSNCNFVAPLEVGDGAYIAAGTTVTEDVAAYTFIIGRVRQSVNDKLAKKYIKKQE